MLTFSRTQRVLLLSLTFVLLAVGVPVLRAALVPPADAAATAQIGGGAQSVYVKYDPRAAGLYAQANVGLNNNWSSAAFTACALNAGGIADINGIQTCRDPNNPIDTTNPVNNWTQLVPTFAQPVREGWDVIDVGQYREGDLIIFTPNSIGNPNTPCFGGIIGASESSLTLPSSLITDSSQLTLYIQRAGTTDNRVPMSTFDPTNWQCQLGENGPVVTATTRLVRINADFTPPALPDTPPVTLDYTGAPQTVAWPAATDDQAGMGTYQVQDSAGNAITEPATAPQALINPGMCSETAYTIVAADAVGNEATTSLTVRTFLQGDFNRDGVLDTVDYDQLERWIAGTETPPPPHADLTGDGVVTIDDLLLLTLRLGESCSVREEGGI